MFKRVCSVALTIAMLLTMLCTFSVASAEVTDKLQLTVTAPAEAERGSTVTVTIGLKNYAGNLQGMAIVAEYDDECLTLEEATAAELGGADPEVNDQVSGEVKADWASTSAFDQAGVSAVLTLKFTVNSNVTLGTTTEIDASFMELHVSSTKEMDSSDYVKDAEPASIKIVCNHSYGPWTKLDESNPDYATKHSRECSKCDDVEYDDHSFTYGGKDETCTENGLKTTSCACGYYKEDVIDELDGHNWAKTGVGEKFEHKHVCTNGTCEASLKVFADTNTEYATKVVTEATCTENKKTEYTCKLCQYSFTVEEENTALGHVFNWIHTQEGDTWYHESEGACTRDGCDATYAKEACNMEVVTPGEGATCYQPAVSDVKCTVCGKEATETTTVPCDTTCTENGNGTHTVTCKWAGQGCTSTGENGVLVESCDDYLEDETAADCENNATKKCSKCGGIVEVPNTATNHNWASGTANGWVHVEGTETNERVCVNPNCPLENHKETTACSYDNGVYTKPTCTARGYTTYTCNLCGHKKTVTDTTAAGAMISHKYKYTHNNTSGTHTHTGVCEYGCGATVSNPCLITTVKATCTTDGKESCSVCGYSKVLKATGHPEAQIVIKYKAPSIINSGYIQLTCKACDGKLDYKKNANLAQGLQYKDLNFKNAAEAKADASNSWYYDPAVFVKSFGLMQGMDGYFKGNNNITRGQVVTVLGRYLWGYLENMSQAEYNALLKSLGGNAKTFKDLKGDWYDRYAVALSTIGVVNGDGDNFKGDNNVTREQLAAFFIRFIDYVDPGSNYTYGTVVAMTDMDTVSDWAKPEATRAAKSGLISGKDGEFDPSNTATRAEMATIMERVVRKHYEYPIEDVV